MMTRKVSVLGRLHCVAKSQRSSLVLVSCCVPTTPLICVLIKVVSIWAEIRPANTATTPVRKMALPKTAGFVPSSTHVWNATNAATYRLKIAPLSPPSITPKPTAKPARIIFNQRKRVGFETKADKARNVTARVNAREANPQQALEKKFPFNAATSPTNNETIGWKPSRRQKYQALN